MKTSLSIALVISIIGLLSALWWRWVYLAPHTLDTVTVRHRGTFTAHPLDSVLQHNLTALQSSTPLLTQFKRAPETVKLTNLWVDTCEVSQGEFRRFSHWRAAQIYPPLTHPQQPKAWTYKSQSQDHKHLGQLTAPAGGLSFYDAWAYCHAAGGRLPTSEEFEAIASGSKQRLYPWGNTFINTPWQHRDPSLNIPRQCATFPTAATPEGIHDLGNSLLEWTTLQGEPVLMGGNAYHRPAALHALNTLRRPAPADFRSPYTGFRCVYVRGAQAHMEIPYIPWASTANVVNIDQRTQNIGAPIEAKIPALLRHLEETQLGAIKHFPITPTTLHLKIMRYEVTRAIYAQFLRDPLVKLGFYNHPRQPQNIDHQPGNWAQQLDKPAHPVTQVNWWNAWAFAKWVGGRLPSANEWQALAGAALTRFPYGNQYQPLRAIDRYYPNTDWQALSVERSKDPSKDGILGLAGNVAEWTNTTVLRGNAFTLVIKGGSFLMPEAGGEVSQAGEAPPNYTSEDLGFRVVFPLANILNP